MVRQNVAIVNFYVSFARKHLGKVSTRSNQQGREVSLLLHRDYYAQQKSNAAAQLD